MGFLEYFIFGTFGFWSISIIGIILLIAFVNNENGTGSFLTLLIGIIFLNWIGKIPIFPYIFENSRIIILIFIGYILMGIIWSLIKYPLYLIELKKEYEHRDYKPDFKNTTKDIVLWMTFWPFSLIWTLGHKFIVNVFETIKDLLSGIYKKMYDKAFPELKK